MIVKLHDCLLHILLSKYLTILGPISILLVQGRI